MSEWIKDLRENAKKYSSEFELICDDPRVTFPNYDEQIYLEGSFTIEQLQDLVTHMKKHKEKQ